MADINFTITIPDSKVSKVVDRYGCVGGCNVCVEVRNHSSDEHLMGESNVNIEEKGETETQIEYGSRIISLLAKLLYRAIDRAIKDSDYRDEVAQISIETTDMDDSIFI